MELLADSLALAEELIEQAREDLTDSEEESSEENQELLKLSVEERRDKIFSFLQKGYNPLEMLNLLSGFRVDDQGRLIAKSERSLDEESSEEDVEILSGFKGLFDEDSSNDEEEDNQEKEEEDTDSSQE